MDTTENTEENVQAKEEEGAQPKAETITLSVKDQVKFPLVAKVLLTTIIWPRFLKISCSNVELDFCYYLLILEWWGDVL